MDQELREVLSEFRQEQKAQSDRLVRIEVSQEEQHNRTRDEMKQLFLDRNRLSDDVKELKTEVKNHKEDHPTMTKTLSTVSAVIGIVGGAGGLVAGMIAWAKRGGG